MAITTVNLTDPVSTWINKTNIIGSTVGDIALVGVGGSDLVTAINRVDSNVGALASLTTTDKSSIVAAINELNSTGIAALDSDVGTVTNLTTTDKSNIVAAINELNAELDRNINDSSEIQALFSVTDAGGDGSLTYNGAGVFTYTGPSAAEVRAHFSAGTGINISSGVISASLGTSITSSEFASATSLVIKDENGTTLKTIYSPGS
jgi:hypothetical protein